MKENDIMKTLIIAGIILFSLLLSSCSPGNRVPGTSYFHKVDADVVTGDEITSDKIVLSGSPVLVPSYGEFYTNAPVTFNCELPGTFYVMPGVLTANETRGFTNDGPGRFTYTGSSVPRVCLVNVVMNLTAPLQVLPVIVQAGIFKNGASENASLNLVFLSTLTMLEQAPLISLVTFIYPGEYIEVSFTCGKADVDLTIYNFTIIITTLD
jgi:hypothetical protein